MTIGKIGGALCLLALHSTAFANPASIPSSVFASLDAYTEARISPDGERLAFLYPMNERNHLVIQALDSGENTVIPPIENLDFVWLQWANDSTLVFSMTYSARRDVGILFETEESRLAAVNVDTGETTPLIKPAEIVGRTGSRVAKEYYGEPQVQDDVIDWLPDEPWHILVSLDEDFDTRNEVRKIDVRDGSYRIVRKSIDGIQTWVTDNAGEIRLGYGYRVGEPRVLLRTADGDWPVLSEIGWFEDGWRPRFFTDDPDVIYVSGVGEHGTLEFRTLRISTGEFIDTVFSHPRYDVRYRMLDPYHRRPVGIGWTEHEDKIMYFDTELAELQAAIDRALPEFNNDLVSATADRRKLLVESESSLDPGVLLIWDRDAGSLEPFGWFNEDLDSELTAPVRPVEYESEDGTVIPAYLTLPIDREARNLPAVVLPHGGPASRDDTSYWFLSQFLVSRGYAVLQPNFRGSRGYGQQFREAGRGQWGGIMQDDVDAGAAWLISEGIADPDRVCIVGWSYGGYSAAIGLVSSPELYQCAAGINGVYNLPQLIADGNKFVNGTVWTRHIGLDGESVRSVSPHHQIDRIDAPLLILHAEDDHRVQIDQARNFHEALQRADKTSRFIALPHGGHTMRNASARQRILDELEAFLGEHIGGR